MKKLVSVILIATLFFCSTITVFALENSDDTQPPSTSAESFVLYCPDNDTVLTSKDENKRMKPASTTKLMTTLLALETADCDDVVVTFTDDMLAEGSSMYLEIGDKVHLSDLATGMMMSSGNDAANAVALTLANSYEDFAELMNSRAREFGMDNTNFVTPSGLDDDNHYSTALDMARLMAKALQNESFAKLTVRKSKKVDFVEPQKHITYSNHNRLLSLYEYCVGGKTGYTESAGRCLVSVAQKDGVTLVCVTMNDRDDWNDHIALYEYGFEQYVCKTYNDSELVAELPCVGSEDEFVTVVGECDTKIIVESDKADVIERRVLSDSFLYAPVQPDDVVGRIEYTLDGKIIMTTNLLAGSMAKRQEDNSIFRKIKDLFNG